MLLLEYSVGYLELRRLKLKNTWQLTPDGRMLTGSTNSFKTVVEVAQVKQIVFYINVRNSAYDFSVKLSSCVCRHTDSSCPGCWLL